ncbi:hypothetical protein GCM10010415_43320 [Streptomyces atrovirens]
MGGAAVAGLQTEQVATSDLLGAREWFAGETLQALLLGGFPVGGPAGQDLGFARHEVEGAAVSAQQAQVGGGVPGVDPACGSHGRGRIELEAV